MDEIPAQLLDKNRLEALNRYQVLDSDTEADYEAITQLAAQICGTPMAQIAFVDDKRQWTKAGRGVVLGESPLVASFCAHAILDPLHPMIIEDARLDERFAHSPLVTNEPNIVFYAGVPLVDPDGFALGSLCVLDQQPRQLSPEQLAALAILTRQVVNLLVLRKTNQELKTLLQREQQSRAEAQTQMQLRLAASESEARFRALIEEAPVATMLMVGPDHTIAVANQAMIDMLGKGAAIIGQPAIQAVPELSTQPFLHLLNQVFASGVVHQAKAMPGDLVVAGERRRHYFDFTYKPLRDSAGDTYGILSMAVDVTQQFVARQQLEEVTMQLRAMVDSAPFPIGVYVGRQMQIRFANQAIIDVYGKGPDVIGKSYLELLPELASQQIFEQLLGVYETGIPFASPTQRVMIEHQGQLVPYYFNYNFTPLFDAQGQVYGVMNTAADVTPLELSRQRQEQTRQQLQEAIDLAELATWSVDIPSGQVSYSERYHEWMGLGQSNSIAHAFDAVAPDEATQLAEAYRQAISPGSTGRLDAEFWVVHVQTNKARRVHIVGQTQRDELGQLVSISGFAQDVTQLRASQRALESLVDERTAQLGSTIERLEETNRLLIRSNEGLQTFAYVASHDLQEPLRKIQSFGDLLKTKQGHLLGEGLDYLQRMQAAAARMSVLILDLLHYSRLTTRWDAPLPVSLEAVVAEVLTTLALTIQEVAAQVQVGALPIVLGDATQLGQLFQNLLSNALKFRRVDTPSFIQVRAALVEATNLPVGIKPSPVAAQYHQIEVIDNGIGFDEKHLSRIFQVFQRLHGKHEFVGTGIGLAICEKVVANHGGAITARSQLGQGATFSVFLPVVQ